MSYYLGVEKVHIDGLSGKVERVQKAAIEFQESLEDLNKVIPLNYTISIKENVKD